MKNWLLVLLALPMALRAQDNYEIQVYSAPTQDKGTSMFELHSNFAFEGEKNIVKGVRPTYHALHETLEITTGITHNFEIGFYLFTNYTPGFGWQVVGTHIRPRIAAPEKWKLPVGLSLSTEFGYQRMEYSSQTWNIEFRPIIDKQWTKWYISFNPTFGVQIKGLDGKTPTFEPNLKVAYAVTSKVSLGGEYYGDVGAFNNWDPGMEQNHAVFAVADLFVDPKWEINFGPGWGLTKATDGFVFKLILGRHVTWKKPATAKTQN
jgi:hypothetical protein